MKQIQTLIITIALSLAISACSPAEGTETVIATSQSDVGPQNSNTIEPPIQTAQTATIATLIPSQEIVERTPTAVSTPALPASTEQEFLFREVLFSGGPDCTLPCWQEIVPGESTEREADEALLSFLGVDLSEADQYDLGILPSTSETVSQQYYSKSYAWYTGTEPADAAFYTRLGVDRSTGLVALLRFKWAVGDSSQYYINLSPQDVIEELGAPAYMGTHLVTTGRSDYGEFALLLAYSQGVVIQFFYEGVTFTVEPTENSAVQATQVELCLSTDETDPESNIDYIVGDVFLMQPFSEDLTGLSPIQASVITDLIEFYDYEPLTDVFGISLQLIEEQIKSGNDVCLSTVINE